MKKEKPAQSVIEKDLHQRQKFLVQPSGEVLGRMLDATCLNPIRTPKELDDLIDSAIAFGYRAVCVAPDDAPLAIERLKGTDVPVCSVVGFPLGYQTTAAKRAETEELIRLGVTEIDYVQNPHFAQNRAAKELELEAATIVASAGGAVVKVILETANLDSDQLQTTAHAALREGVHYLKTSTGFGKRGASISDISQMALVAAEYDRPIGIKASGGVRDYKAATQMIQAGATCIGCSSPQQITGISNLA